MLHRASSCAVLVACLLALASLAGCSCSSPGGPGRMRDGGGTLDASVGPGIDSSVNEFPDSGPPRDSGPAVDGGCDLTTPIMNEVIGDPPDMLLVVDVSGSMCTDTFPPSGSSKLAIMKAAMSSLVAAKDARINFGMMLFPAASTECGAGTVVNPIAPRNAPAITASLAALVDAPLFSCVFANVGATPTHLSLDAARTYYATLPVNPIGRYVVLATDGLPNCGPPLPDGEGTEETIDETVAAIQALHDAGILTYVVGFGSDLSSDPTALARMATAGGTGTPYSATSAAALDAALDAIAAEILPPSCTIELDGPTRDPALFQVRFDGGALIPRDPSRTRGWDYDPATNTITFYGAECATLQSGSVPGVDVDFGCPGPLI